MFPLFFGSHVGDADFIKQETGFTIRNTTSLGTIVESMKKIKEAGKKPIVFSTYHSSYKLKSIEWDIFIGDEAHFATDEQFSRPQNKKSKQEFFVEEVEEDENSNDIFWEAVTSKIKLFITATPRHTKGRKSGARGMQNKEVYGNVDYQILPKTLEELGFTVAPYLHFMHIDKYPQSENGTMTETNRNMLFDIVGESFAHSYDYFVSKKGMKQVKELVTVNGVAHAKSATEFCNALRDKIMSGDVSKKYKGEFAGADVDILSIASKFGAYINNEEVDRNAFLDHIRNSDRNMIIFHYDILTEGIDVAGINSQLILRERGMMKIKTIQLLGRGLRIADNKDCCMIFIPIVANEDSNGERIKNLLIQMRSANYDPSSDIMIDGKEFSIPVNPVNPIWDTDVIKFSDGDSTRAIESIFIEAINLDDDDIEDLAQIDEDKRKDDNRKKKGKMKVASLNDLLELLFASKLKEV